MLDSTGSTIEHDIKQLSSKSLAYLFNSAIFVIIIAIVAIFVWHYSYQQQLQTLNKSAQNNLNLYSNMVQYELDQVNNDLLTIIANHDVVQQFLKTPIFQKKLKAINYLTKFQSVFIHRQLFIGYGKNIVLVDKSLTEEQKKDNLAMLETWQQTISRRAYKNKKTEQLLFSQKNTQAKYLYAYPILTQHKTENSIIGYIGLLVDLAPIQKELAQSILTKQQVILVSDQNGIIILSSNPSWLYQAFSTLPYHLKKQLDANFNEKNLFKQLAIANINDDILTTTNQQKDKNNQSYLVQSILLSPHQLRIHHLANTAPIINRSSFYAAFVSISLILLTLFGLFIREKRQAQMIQQQHQQALTDLDIEFKQQQKLASMGMMATTIAHDINQPITAIKTEAKIASKCIKVNNVNEVETSLKNIDNHAKLLSSITTQLKDFARHRSNSASQAANINNVLKQSITLNNSRLSEENVYCYLEKFDHSLQAKIDEYQLQQVINNLIQNACDAMQACDNKRINIQVSSRENSITILISDNGTGIKTTLQESLFNPFVSNKNNNNAMGLGLAICHDIISKVGGTIELITAPQNSKSDTTNCLHGAHFKISLLKISSENNAQ